MPSTRWIYSVWVFERYGKERTQPCHLKILLSECKKAKNILAVHKYCEKPDSIQMWSFLRMSSKDTSKNPAPKPLKEEEGSESQDEDVFDEDDYSYGLTDDDYLFGLTDEDEEEEEDS